MLPSQERRTISRPYSVGMFVLLCFVLAWHGLLRYEVDWNALDYGNPGQEFLLVPMDIAESRAFIGICLSVSVGSLSVFYAVVHGWKAVWMPLVCGYAFLYAVGALLASDGYGELSRGKNRDGNTYVLIDSHFLLDPDCRLCVVKSHDWFGDVLQTVSVDQSAESNLTCELIPPSASKEYRMHETASGVIVFTIGETFAPVAYDPGRDISYTVMTADNRKLLKFQREVRDIALLNGSHLANGLGMLRCSKS